VLSCHDRKQVADVPGSYVASVGAGWAAWSALDRTEVRLTSGRAAPVAIAPGYVPFRSIGAYGDTLVYAVEDVDGGANAVLHVQTVRAS
jgi:F420-0:gamma-glutamyl ligase-like protein